MNNKKKFGARKGATFIEYALLAGLVAVVVAAAAMFFGDDLRELFTQTGKQTEKVTEGVKNTDLSSSFQKTTNDQQNNANK